MKTKIKKEIVASIIATSQKELEERVNKVKDYAKIIQLDIMDGTMTPTHTLDFDFKLPKNKCKVEAHLMLKDPLTWIKKNGSIADTIIFHIESCKTADEAKKMIHAIREINKDPAVAIAPGTSAEAIFPYLKDITQVLVFTADPIGYYGAKFSPAAIDKIKKIRKINNSITIEVDGGVGIDNISSLSGAGVNLFVSGSYLQKSINTKQAISTLLKLV